MRGIQPLKKVIMCFWMGLNISIIQMAEKISVFEIDFG